MAYIKCDGCGEIVEIPAELCPDPESIAITEPYYCDACEVEEPSDPYSVVGDEGCGYNRLDVPYPY